MARRAEAASTPLDGVDLLLADLDGVVYTGRDALPYAVESINRAQNTIRVGYLTNNASRTDAAVASHLTELGLTVAPEDVVTSPQAAVALLAGLVPAGSKILVVGGAGLVDELHKAGFSVTRSADGDPAAVVQGFAPEVGWTDLAEASFALQARPGRDDLPWVATNTDWTIPQARGIAPGNGTLVSAVHSAIGRLPVVAGKPERAIFDAAVARFRASNPLFVGDRLDTDILGSNRAGIRSALVMTGIDRAKQVLAAPEESRPSYLLGDLRELFEPYPHAETRAEKRSGDTLVGVREAVVRIHQNRIGIDRAGSRSIDLLRAGAAAIWGTGVPIYALEVDPGLYSES
ncbi:MAG TPA: HAD-IIA family hydrolase [Pseudolysinimonas sp.]|nr:HAD-IIA family hydrolase [Pseudolysinimonas sp.]